MTSTGDASALKLQTIKPSWYRRSRKLPRNHQKRPQVQPRVDQWGSSVYRFVEL